ncbi:KxYKxGKxW signal peptide domain-containing protein [Streptococcus halichoeri]|uniref:KxYKxGKxW signal peptide domain-containing protein n=1 Tax=Streptococcus halichoeri TaxID=254785 RepID=UPI00135B11D4|nr:KxYKxGKxW signal peptide domain-containing protein [Streptococcus halichoeri]
MNKLSMNKLKGKFRAWKSGKHWMYAGVMVIIATGMCTAKVTLADTSALEKQGNNNNDSRAYLNREEENNRSQFAQGSQEGYDDAGFSGSAMTLSPDLPQELQETYRDGYLEGQKDKAKKDALEAALQDEEDRELDDKLIDQQISGYGLGVFTAICKLVKTVVTFFFSWF